MRVLAINMLLSVVVIAWPVLYYLLDVRPKKLARKRHPDLAGRRIDRIRVDFAKCDVMENVEITGDAASGPDSYVPGNAMALMAQHDGVEETVVSYIVYKTVYKGSDTTFVSEPIEKNKETLEFYLDNKKSTSLIIDKFDAQKYYFDLGFLKLDK